jgi:allantoate deiminase
MARCARLGEISEEPGLLVRRFATGAMREANDCVRGWMGDAGLAVHEDAGGNLIGRRAGAVPNAPALLLGSHLDSVRDAGRYDGPLGVLAGLAVVERLGHRQLPFAVEVVAFADEEGTRYGTAFLGSAAMAGTWDPAWADWKDAEGIALGDALRAFGGDPDAIATAARRPDQLLGYLELHIEQGPVLEARDSPVGVVTAITGMTLGEAVFTGVAGHAGTVPMDRRRDALGAAAELVLAAEALARAEEGLVATVGELEVRPGARNVIPALARASIDVRHIEDDRHRSAAAALRASAEEIAARRGVTLAWESRGELAAVPADPGLSGRLADAISTLGLPVERLPSGAGHDAATMAALTASAMLFVRCRDGISHNPAESVEEADVAVALDVLERVVVGLA